MVGTSSPRAGQRSATASPFWQPVHLGIGVSPVGAPNGLWIAVRGQKLVRLRVLEEVTGRRRGRVFAYGQYLAILSEGTDPLTQ